MWQRFVIVFSILGVGCVATLPSDPGISADLATEAARMVVVLRQGPPPAPEPDKECANCNGSGKIGDGRIVMTCPECGGTGKAAGSVLHPAVFVPLNAEVTP